MNPAESLGTELKLPKQFEPTRGNRSLAAAVATRAVECLNAE
jgi:hypothetical protein